MQRRYPYKQISDNFDHEAIRQFIASTGVLVGFDPNAYPGILDKSQWRLGIRTFLGTDDAGRSLQPLRRHELVALSRVVPVETPEDGVRATTLRRRFAEFVGAHESPADMTMLRTAELRHLAVMLAGNHEADEESVTAANTEQRRQAGPHSSRDDRPDDPESEPEADSTATSDADRAYTKDDLIDHLRTLTEEHGAPPTVDTIDSEPGPSATVYYEHFGDIFSAREAAGVGHPSGASTHYHSLVSQAEGGE
jgi:hypothetical protein